MSEFVEVKYAAAPTTSVLVTLEEAEEAEAAGLLIPTVTTPSSDDVLTYTDVWGE